MTIPNIIFVSEIINIILLLATLFFVYIVLRIMIILGPKDTKKSMMFPILIAGILMLPMAGTELYRATWVAFAFFHSVLMLSVVFTLTFGMYNYYRMLKKTFSWEIEQSLK